MDTGVIVDIETTGLDANIDEIIEIGILEFSTDQNYQPIITRMYSGLAEPSRPITEEISQLTGITDASLKGQSIDWQLVADFLSSSSVVIAHNFGFEKSFLRKRPELQGLPLHWACSMEHVNWKKHGFKTQNLNYLAADHGFLNPFAHRALFDCATTLRLIAPYLPELIQRSYEREFAIFAEGAPFEAKDALRQRGYRWDPERRVWHCRIAESALEAERLFLSQSVYTGPPRHREDILSTPDPTNAEAS